MTNKCAIQLYNGGGSLCVAWEEPGAYQYKSHLASQRTPKEINVIRTS